MMASMRKGGLVAMAVVVVMMGVMGLLLPAASAASAYPTYTFPERWEAVLDWWVQDAGMGMKKVHALAYVYTDYTPSGSLRLGQQRVDELYYLPEFVSTPFSSEFGMDSDHHLQSADANHYFFFNASGQQCFRLPASGPQPAQYAFANESTYVGGGNVNGKVVFIFQTKVEVAPGLVSPVSLYVDVESRLPVRFSMAGVPPYDMIGPNEMNFLKFNPVWGPFPTAGTLFTPPSACLKQGEASLLHALGSFASGLAHRRLARGL